jgi:hypothetical protein
MKKMHGDVLRINITPPGQSYPWIHIFVHEYGIKQALQQNLWVKKWNYIY